MPWSLDARIPLLIVLDEGALSGALASGPPTAVLAEGLPPALPAGAVALASYDLSGPRHASGCACCGARPPAAAALDRLFQARVRAACPWFDRVLALAASDTARAALSEALSEDAVTSARFRFV